MTCTQNNVWTLSSAVLWALFPFVPKRIIPDHCTERNMNFLLVKRLLFVTGQFVYINGPILGWAECKLAQLASPPVHEEMQSVKLFWDKRSFIKLLTTISVGFCLWHVEGNIAVEFLQCTFWHIKLHKCHLVTFWCRDNGQFHIWCFQNQATSTLLKIGVLKALQGEWMVVF